MKLIALFAIVAVAVAAPDSPYSRRYGSGSGESGEIISQDFIIEDDGRYNAAHETTNGIAAEQFGAPSGPQGAVESSGTFSWTAPDGTPVVVRFVADANGYQPESNLLPVAPEFPHPIPDFVLAQIAKAEEEDRHRSREYYN